MSIVFSNVSIEKMNFINEKNDIKFEFIDSYKDSNNYCGEMTCKNIYTFKMDTAFEDDEFCFPCFICDITSVKLDKSQIDLNFKKLEYEYKYSDGTIIPKSEEYHLVRMEGGEVNISIICGKVELNKL